MEVVCPTMKHFGLDEVALLISMEVVKQSGECD